MYKIENPEQKWNLQDRIFTINGKVQLSEQTKWCIKWFDIKRDDFSH